jgi:tripartite-type tricarboxylate transporter receptor subunit TctC
LASLQADSFVLLLEAKRMKPTTIRPTTILCALALAAMCATGAVAQPYPSRPITIIVPYPAGGPLDQVARTMAEPMRATLGQPLIVENVSGAAGSIGAGRVARAAPNGYTIGLGDVGTQVLNGAVFPLTYDVMTDFEPVGLLVASPLLILSRANLPAKNLLELTAWLKQNQAKVSQGFIGSGSLSHLCGLYLQDTIKAKWPFVPYRGAAPAIQDLIGGQVDIMCLAASGATLSLARSGKVRAYAVMAPERLAAGKEFPTADEAGLKGFQLSFWQSFWVPKGTPKDIVAKLNAATVAALADPAVHGKLSGLGFVVPPRAQQTPEALDALRKAEAAKWWPIIKAAGIKPD